MQCRSCGTEIADKAIVCYRCGTPTTEAKFKPAAAKRGRSRAKALIVLLVLLVLALIAFFLLHSSPL